MTVGCKPTIDLQRTAWLLSTIFEARDSSHNVRQVNFAFKLLTPTSSSALPHNTNRLMHDGRPLYLDLKIST